MAKAKASARRGGRKKNEWTLVTLDDLMKFIDTQGLTQNKFAKTLGVTNSTFHNWKNGRCAPDEAIQGKIKALIDGKEKIDVSDNKTDNENKAKTRGTKSSTLAALGKKGKGKTTKKAKKKTKKKVTKALEKGGSSRPKVEKALKKTKKKAAKKAKATKPVLNGNGNGAYFDPSAWNELEALGQFVKANPGKSPEEIAELLGTVSRVAAIFA